MTVLPMIVLIVGAGGQLGRALLEHAPARIRAVGLDRNSLDITDAAAVGAAVEAIAPDIIINAAAYTAVDRAESEQDLAFAINAAAPGHLAQAAARRSCRMVHVSTDFVFDGTASSPIAPDAPMAPINIYGASKAAGEAAVRDAMPDALILRTAWVYSARANNFVATMLRLAASQDQLRVVADQIGTPTHVDGLARMIWQLADLGASGTHHHTDAGTASWYDFAHAIVEQACRLGLLPVAVPVIPLATAQFPTPARRPAYSVLDKRSTWDLVGQPARHWQEELDIMLNKERTGS